MASHQSPSERGMAGEQIPGGTEGRSEQSGNCLHWLQNVDPDSNDVSPVCIREMYRGRRSSVASGGDGRWKWTGEQ